MEKLPMKKNTDYFIPLQMQHGEQCFMLILTIYQVINQNLNLII